ncbi:dTDP-4-dehydrorhamnose reductase [Sideroxydans lithotrophicus]|uniref:dTDP-4-dehydrorhamnose reductase n=1 Tax=Sideroxydans lithotrophicus (strain ES-1) TaxID=580332 RepID=D5CQB5_SIDLE|nr:dTDP-4-dehydrorhamnose reductase [Sideroxydans lithotrophicus]ADE13136.1 dTDP-4-dehydrorhamnose reductase [Sideroxydans lithotrophicus ES-1]
MKRILVTGKNGQVGWELQRSLAAFGEIIALDSDSMDLADPDAIRRTIREVRPDIIVNPAAYTAVDKAESEMELANAVNGIAPGVLAEEAKLLGAILVHYSTDYVFDGSKPAPYVESDVPNPQSVYGRTKLAGEQAVRASGCKHLIFRTSWVYGVHGGNFVKTMLRLARERNELRIVADQFGAPTWAKDIANSTATALHNWQQLAWDDRLSGLYHLTAAGRTNWHQFAETIIREARKYDTALAAKTIAVNPIATHEYPLPAKRPVNSVLANDKVRNAFGIAMPEWQDSLVECVRLLYAQP